MIFKIKGIDCEADVQDGQGNIRAHLAFPTQQNAPVSTAPVINTNVQNVLNPEVHQTPAGVVEVFLLIFLFIF